LELPHSIRWDWVTLHAVIAPVPLQKIKITLAFDGSAYHGWQSQRSGRGVQDAVQAALARGFGSALPVVGSSRTDTGVHARGLVAHFEVAAEQLRMPIHHLTLAINAWLPEDIRVMDAALVPPTFHARFDASGKQYRYRIWNHPAMNPLLRSHAWHVPRPLDLAAMREAAAMLVGRHDFRAFTSNRGVLLEDAVRTITRCSIRKLGHEMIFIIEGSGFLYKMCRCMVGTLIQVGELKFSPSDIQNMLEGKDRRNAGMNAPAQGLILWEVIYQKAPADAACPEEHSS
jgi:tRNA pseudouridine38-40 synthase